MKFIEELLISEKYIETLEKVAKLLNDFNQELIFQDESAPRHRSKKVHEYKEINKLDSLDWPGNSPDLNPIENLWSLLKGKIGRILVKNKAELKRIINEKFTAYVSQEYINCLIDSMPKRISECIKNKGYVTKY